MKGKDFDFYFREFRIGRLRIYHHVKIEATALGFAKLLLLLRSAELEEILNDAELSAEAKVALSMLISQIDRIVRSSIRAEEKVEKVEALLYTWIVGNKLPAWWQCERDGEESIEELGEILAEIVEVAHAQARKGGEKKKEVKGDEGKTH